MSEIVIKDFLEDFSEKEFLTYEKDEILFKENDRVKGIFCVISGCVKCISFENLNKETILYLFKPGEVLGLHEVINENTYSTRAVAYSRANVCFIPGKEFLKLIESEPRFSFKVMQVLCKKITLMEDKIISKIDKSAGERFAELLVLLSHNYGIDEDSYLKVELSRKDIANLVGTSYGSINTKISEFAKNKWIDTKGNRIKMLNMSAIEEFSGANDLSA